jgi:hypothetical protein
MTEEIKTLMGEQENIYEPLELYCSRFKDEQARNASSFFEDLVKKSGVNETQNAATVTKIRDKEANIAKESSLLAKTKSLKGFLTFLSVALFLLGGFLISTTSGESLTEGTAIFSTVIVFIAAIICGVSVTFLQGVIDHEGNPSLGKTLFAFALISSLLGSFFFCFVLSSALPTIGESDVSLFVALFSGLVFSILFPALGGHNLLSQKGGKSVAGVVFVILSVVAFFYDGFLAYRFLGSLLDAPIPSSSAGMLALFCLVGVAAFLFDLLCWKKRLGGSAGNFDATASTVGFWVSMALTGCFLASGGFLVGLVIADFTVLAFSPVVSILGFLLCFLLGTGLAVFIVLSLHRAIKKGKATLANLNEEKRILVDEAYQQMQPLNDLFDWGMPQTIFQQTVPLVKMDAFFDSRRFECMHNKYGLSGNGDSNRSVVFVQSGEIIGNPFLLSRSLTTWIGSKVYTGSLNISWTESHYENGKLVTETHHQTLTASREKPFPCYGQDTSLIYCNEAAPNLSFSRSPSPAKGMNDKAIAHFVDKKSKEINKMSEKSVSSGHSFTAMANTEFEALFGAFDRNDEVGFRLLYTPMAQRETTSLIKDKATGYGDDWSFSKNGGINVLHAEHLNNQDLSGQPGLFIDYELQASRKKFADYNNGYFRSLFFALAPLLAVPLYQQQKPHEYIYRDVSPTLASSWEHEYLVNQMNINFLRHPSSITTNILKTNLVSSDGETDQIKITANGYKGIDRIDYVDVLGGDGRIHSVPVPWVEYLPVSKDTMAYVHSATNLSRPAVISHASKWQAFLFPLSSGSGGVLYQKNLVSFLVNGPLTEQNLGKLKELFAENPVDTNPK